MVPALLMEKGKDGSSYNQDTIQHKPCTFFFFDKYHKYIKGQRPPSIQDVYKSASKREHKNKDPYPPLSGR